MSKPCFFLSDSWIFKFPLTIVNFPLVSTQQDLTLNGLEGFPLWLLGPSRYLLGPNWLRLQVLSRYFSVIVIQWSD